MIEKYGADAVRLSLIMGSAPGNDLKLSEDRIRGYKNFANKIWNISRFIFENTENTDPGAPLTSDDQALIKEVEDLKGRVLAHVEGFRLDLAADELYQFIWHRFADNVIEESKAILKGDDVGKAASRKAALLAMLKVCLKLLHPFMPFVTEEIWSEVKGDAPYLMVERI